MSGEASGSGFGNRENKESSGASGSGFGNRENKESSGASGSGFGNREMAKTKFRYDNEHKLFVARAITEWKKMKEENEKFTEEFPPMYYTHDLDQRFHTKTTGRELADLVRKLESEKKLQKRK